MMTPFSNARSSRLNFGLWFATPLPTPGVIKHSGAICCNRKSLRENLRSFFIVENIEAVLQATTEMAADQTPVNHYDIKLEGESTTDIWAVKTIFGKGEGSSVLYYDGNPTIDYLTQGNAQILSR